MRSATYERSPRKTEGNRGQRLSELCLNLIVFASGMWFAYCAGIIAALLLLEVF